MNNPETPHMVSVPFQGGPEHVDLKIRKGHGAIWIESKDFIANTNHLRIFYYLAQGLEISDVANTLSLYSQTVKNTLTEAKIKNIKEIDGIKVQPSRIDLIIKAEQLGLLSPLVLIGIESIANAGITERFDASAE